MGARKQSGGRFRIFAEVEKAAGGVGPRNEDIMEVDMLRDAGVLPASSLEASVQQQHDAEEEEVGDTEAEVLELGDAWATPTVYTPSSSNRSVESGGVSRQQQQWDGDGVGGGVPQVDVGQNGSTHPFDPGANTMDLVWQKRCMAMDGKGWSSRGRRSTEAAAAAADAAGRG